MNDEMRGILTIRYVNGAEEKYEFALQTDDPNIVTRIQELLKANQLILEMEDRVRVIPMQNVQIMEVSPSPPKLPSNVVRDVRQIS